METTVKIIRSEQTYQGALGSLTLLGRLFCSTLEPDSNDPDRSQISPGIYFCKRRDIDDDIDVKYHHTFEIMVPGHTNVLFHWGNEEVDTEMCIVLGQYPCELNGIRAVLNSKNTFDKFMEALKDVDWFYLEIKDDY